MNEELFDLYPKPGVEGHGLDPDAFKTCPKCGAELISNWNPYRWPLYACGSGISPEYCIEESRECLVAQIKRLEEENREYRILLDYKSLFPDEIQARYGRTVE